MINFTLLSLNLMGGEGAEREPTDKLCFGWVGGSGVAEIEYGRRLLK
jgi:hypothetical protein